MEVVVYGTRLKTNLNAQPAMEPASRGRRRTNEIRLPKMRSSFTYEYLAQPKDSYVWKVQYYCGEKTMTPEQPATSLGEIHHVAYWSGDDVPSDVRAAIGRYDQLCEDEQMRLNRGAQAVANHATAPLREEVEYLKSEVDKYNQSLGETTIKLQEAERVMDLLKESMTDNNGSINELRIALGSYASYKEKA
jgi:hypothetical protein